MSVLLQFDALEQVVLPAGPVHLAIGMFDGVHLGHRSVIAAAVQDAHRAGGLAGVLTFTPHPSAVLRPDAPTPLLLTPGLKRRRLAALGIDFLVEHPFTPGFAATTAQAFVTLLARTIPGLKAVYVGENFRFGRGREGDVATLLAAARAAGFAVWHAPRLQHAGEPISSSRLRALVAAGEVEAAAALLGAPYASEGVVEKGRQLGRGLGFPTLNLQWHPGVQPRHGVYAVTVSGPDCVAQPAVANYGLRPTVETGATRPLLEVHVLVPTTLAYGDAVEVRWLRFLRPERKFGDVDALREQVKTDCAEARAVHAEFSVHESPNSA